MLLMVNLTLKSSSYPVLKEIKLKLKWKRNIDIFTCIHCFLFSLSRLKKSLWLRLSVFKQSVYYGVKSVILRI